MSEKEERIIKAMDKNIKHFNELQKEYLLGFVEGMAQAQKPKRKKKKTE